LWLFWKMNPITYVANRNFRLVVVNA
jgi:hypothetical protein